MDEPVHCPIQNLIIQPSLDGSERDLLKSINFSAAPTIVCDPNTHEVLAARIAAALPSAKVTVVETPRADQATVDQLTDKTRHAEALVAVGAGTLNDLVKYISHQRRQPYVVFATAPSMNGYVTATASISRDGEKLSLPATPPKGAFFDLSVLAKAPPRLIRAGVGDSLCRSTAEVDWYLSHQLLGTQFLDMPFAIQAKDETKLLDCVGKLKHGDLEAIEALVRLLILGGLGMVIVGNSQPGSQGEHLISHYIDMLHHPHPGSLHGEQVGLATRTMANLQHEILARENAPILTGLTIAEGEMAKRFGERSTSLVAGLKAKALSREQLAALNERLAKKWPAVRDAVRDRALPLSRLRNALDLAGVAAKSEDIGVDPAFYREAVLHARELRDRFTMLDFAANSGILAPFIERHLACH